MQKPPQQPAKAWATLTAAELEAVPGKLQARLAPQQQVDTDKGTGAAPSLQKGFGLFKRHHRP